MYVFESNLADVIRKYVASILAAARMAEGPDSDVDRLLREGAQSHFNRLSLGGGIDPTALGPGQGSTSVSWAVGKRHRFTVLAHARAGISSSQLLIHTGALRDSVTSQANVQGWNEPWGSQATLRPSTAASAEKLRRNLGGEFTTDFPTIAKSGVLVRFPERQVLYWDALMRHRVLRRGGQLAEDAWQK